MWTSRTSVFPNTRAYEQQEWQKINQTKKVKERCEYGKKYSGHELKKKKLP